MKKLLLIAITFISINVYSQCSSCYVGLWNKSADTVSVGDSAYVDIKYSYSFINDKNKKVYFYVSLNLVQVAVYTFLQLDSIPKIPRLSGPPNDSVTRIKFVIPNGVLYGATKYYISHYSGSGGDIFINTPTAIIEHDLSKSIKSISYYNIVGQQIEKPSYGLTISRIVYDDGSIKTTKEFVQ